MKIRWQLWFLVSFLVCGTWCIWDTMTAYSKGEALAEANWKYIQTTETKTLKDYCAKYQITGDAKTPQAIRAEVFDPQKNPLICSPTLEEARSAYGLFVQTVARKSSMRMTFMFMGAWLVILLAAFGLQTWLNRRAAKGSR